MTVFIFLRFFTCLFTFMHLFKMLDLPLLQWMKLVDIIWFKSFPIHLYISFPKGLHTWACRWIFPSSTHDFHFLCITTGVADLKVSINVAVIRHSVFIFLITVVSWLRNLAWHRRNIGLQFCRGKHVNQDQKLFVIQVIRNDCRGFNNLLYIKHLI